MTATTGKKARLLDLVTGVLEMARDETRDIDEVSDVLQTVKDKPDFAHRLGSGDRAIESDLELVDGNISVVTDSFARDSFFGEDGSEKFVIHENFRNWIIAGLPETIPAFQGMLRKHRIRKQMNDWKIIGEMGGARPFTSIEFAAALRHLVTSGEKGWYLFYVQLEDGRLIVALVLWNSENRDWYLFANSPGGIGGFDGNFVFSCS